MHLFCVYIIGYEKSHEVHREHAQPPIHQPENTMDQPQNTVDEFKEAEDTVDVDKLMDKFEEQ